MPKTSTSPKSTKDRSCQTCGEVLIGRRCPTCTESTAISVGEDDRDVDSGRMMMPDPDMCPTPRHVQSFIAKAKRSPVIKLRHVASIVGLSARTLRRDIESGELPAFKVGKRNGDWAVTHAAATNICRVIGMPPLPTMAL